jgi:outer membrane lipoprotein carrier protein
LPNRLVLTLLLACGCLQPAFAGKARESLDHFLNDVKSLQAQFRQSVVDTENNRTGDYEGVFYLQRPDRFRWEYVAPFKQQIIGGERLVWVVEVDLEQAVVYSRRVALKGTPAALLTTNRPVEEEFEVIEIGERQEMLWLELLPRDPESDLTRLLLAFRDNQLLRMDMVDSFGQISRFQFYNLQLNPVLDAGLFEYVPPPETDIYNY